jgi:hypothetical protein
MDWINHIYTRIIAGVIVMIVFIVGIINSFEPNPAISRLTMHAYCIEGRGEIISVEPISLRYHKLNFGRDKQSLQAYFKPKYKGQLSFSKTVAIGDSVEKKSGSWNVEIIKPSGKTLYFLINHAENGTCD